MHPIDFEMSDSMFKMSKEDWQECGGVILFGVWIIIFFIFGMIMQTKINKYNNEHPCIRTETKVETYTTNDCVGGIMLPGFCITKEREHTRTYTYCIERK